MNIKHLSFLLVPFFLFSCICAFAQAFTPTFPADSTAVSVPLTPGQQYMQAYDRIMSFEGLDTKSVLEERDLFFEYIRRALRKGDLYLHMATQPVDKHYKPECLVSIAELNKKGAKIAFDPQHYPSEYKVSAVLTDDLTRMFQDASRAGYKIRVCSAYRSYEYQIQLIEKFREANLGAYVARPGLSEHCIGLACDIEGPTKPYINTKECRWTMANCEKYGFVMTMPPGGYPSEPWHYRYIGHEGVAFKNKFFFGKPVKMLRFVSEHRQDIADILDADHKIKQEQRKMILDDNLKKLVLELATQSRENFLQNAIKPINIPAPTPKTSTKKKGR